MGTAIVAGAVAAGTISVTTGAVLATVINLAIAAILGKILAPDRSDGRDNKGLQRNVRNNIVPRRIIYGECIAGGPYAAIETKGSDNEELTFTIVLSGHPVEDILGIILDDQYLSIDGRWPAGGSDTNDLDSSYFIDTGFFGSSTSGQKKYHMLKVVKNLGFGYADLQYVTVGGGQDALDDRIRAAETSTTFSDTAWLIPDVTTRDSDGLYDGSSSPANRVKLTNCAHITCRFRYEPDIITGWPEPRFHVKGKRLYNPYFDSALTDVGAAGGSHDIDDPDTWEWSEDWTLCVLDYLINTSYGLGAKTDLVNRTDASLNEIDWAAVVQSYIESSEIIDNGLPSSHRDFGTAPRYTVNGIFEVSATPISIMESLLTSGSGELIYAQGQYKIRPGVYREPNSSTDIINEDMMVGPLTIQTHTPRTDLFNKAAGVFVDKGYDEFSTKNSLNKPLFISSDFQIVNPLDSSGQNPYEVQDGEEIIEEFDYPFTVRNYEAQRLARIQLERVRRGFTVSFQATLEVLKYSVGDTVYLEILNDSKYIGRAFYNRLGLDDEVQDRPDTPFTPYYKQFKIISMEYSEEFTIDVVMVEESEVIYDWNNGDASPDDAALESEIVVEEPLGQVEPPDFVVASPAQTITEIVTATGNYTHVRWTAPDRGSIINQIDRAHIGSYILEYGIIDNPSAPDPADRVSSWSPGGIFIPEDRTLLVQGPIAIPGLYIDDFINYDFRCKSVTFTGRTSAWAYYSTDIGSDYGPTSPSATTRYYIAPTNGTAIKNGIGTLTIEAREVTSSTDTLLTSGNIKLYVGSVEVTVANGYTTPSDGYTGTFDSDDINDSVLVELRDDVEVVTYDTITLVDVLDGVGSDATSGYINVHDVLVWHRLPDDTWDPTDTSSNVDVTFVRGGIEVARWSRTIDRDVFGGLSDGGAATHDAGSNLNTGHITPVVTLSPLTYVATVAYSYDDGAGNIDFVSETLSTGRDGRERYYILPTNGTAIKNGTGTLTIEARLVNELGDNILSAGTIKLFDPSNDIIDTANGYPSPSDGYTGTLGINDINSDILITLKDGVGGDVLDTIALVDVLDGASSIVGWIEPEFLAWRRDINGGVWVPSQTTSQFDIIFNEDGLDVARQGYEITRAASGTLTGATNTAASPGNLNTSRISLNITGSGTTNLTVRADYSFGGKVGSVSETIFSVTGGDDSEFYYILPLNGNAIQNGVGTLQIEAHKVTGAVDVALTSGTIQLYDSLDNLVHTDSPGNYPSPSDGYFGTFNRLDIAGSEVITLKDGPSGQPLDTITLVDTLDGATAPDYARTMIYDDLDTTTLAAGASRYAILSARGTNTSGMQSGFETADGILINKEDRDGSNHSLYYKGLFIGSQISYVISTDRWFTYKIDETYETVGTGATEAYKFGVTLIDYRDLSPSDTISTSAGTDVEFQFVEPIDPDGSLVLDPDFDLLNTLPLVTDESSAGFWDNSSYWVATKNMTSPSSSPGFGSWGWTLNVGSGPNSSNTVSLQAAIPITSGYTEGWLVSRKRIRTNTPSFVVKIRARNVDAGANDCSISVQMRGYSNPTSGTVQATASRPWEILKTDGTTYEDYELLVEAASDVDAQYWEFRIGFHHISASFNVGEIEIDSVFVYPSARTFGTYTYSQVSGNDQINPGLVPQADTVTDAGSFLRSDGVWATGAGGSGSGFSTHTITDTDSGFSWAATGSAIASSPYTLTWVSGTGIDIDVDAASDAIRVTNTAGDGTFEGLSDTSTSGKTSGSMLVWDGATDWVDTGSDVTWISGGGTFAVDGTVTATDRVIIYDSVGGNSMQLDNDGTDFIMNALNVTGGISIINNTLIEALTSTIHADAFRSYNGTDYVVLQHNGTDVAEIEFDSTTTRLNLGLSSSAFRELRMMGGIKLQEQVAPVAATTAYGQIWVKTAVPNELWFTNDAGTAVQLGVGGGGGTVTSVSVTTANGVSGTVATPTTTPAISLTLGAITPTSTNGILAANLLSRISTEQVTGLWEFSRAVSTSIVLDNSGVGSAGIRFQNNNGTRGYLEMDNSGTFSTLTSAAAATGFSVTSAGNIAATNLSGTNTGDNAGVTSVTGGVGVDSTGGTTPSITLDVAELAVGGTLLATDHLIAANGVVSNKQLISSIPLSIFNNDLSSSDAAIELNIRADINTATPPTTELVDARLMFLDLAATDDIASVGFTNNNTFSIDNLMHGGEIRLRGQDTAGNQRTFLFGDPNAATGLYGDTEIQFWINNVEQAVLDGTDFQVDVPIKLLERAAAVGNDTGYGQLWTNSSNSHLYYTTDGGTQYQISGATGTVTSSGSPLNNEVAVFSSATDINSDSTFTWDGTTLAATNFSGNGSGLTSLTAANISTGNLADGVDIYVTAISSTTIYKMPFVDHTGTTSGNYGLLMEAGGTFTYQPSTDILTCGTFAGLLSGTQSNTLTFSAVKTTFNTLFLNEKTSPQTNVAGDGQIWVRTEANGSRLYYTDDTDQDFPVGMAAYNLVANQSSNMTTDTVAQSLVAGMWYSNNATAYTLTLEPSTDTEFPVGAQLTVANQGAGTLTINEGSGGQLLYSDGSGAFTDTAGGMTLANGGYLTIIRMTTVIWYAMGAGGTP